MNINAPRFWVAGLAFMLMASSAALGQRWDKKTNLTVHERIEVPGAMLEPGNYVLKLVDSDSNRHIVRFMNEQEDQVISTVIAIPNQRLQVTGETEFAWYERPAGEPRALRAWFYPGDNFGQEFVYPESRATTIAAATGEPVPSIADDQEPRMRGEVRPEEPPAEDLRQAEVRPAEPVRPAQPREEPEQLAQVRPQQPVPERQQEEFRQIEPRPLQDEPTTLPETSGLGPLFGLLALGALGASAGLGFALRRK